MQTLGLSSAAAAVGGAAQEARAAIAEAAGPTTLGPDPVAVRLTVNGLRQEITIDPATTLLEAIRGELGLTGCKEICDRGACGGCSVLVDGKLVVSCMMLAIDAEDRRIETVEGLATGDQLTALQEAFIRHDALQCGFCTPGLVVACTALLREHPKPTLEQIKRGISGNLCRCGTYTNIFNAVLDASGQPVPADPAPPWPANGGA
ncbi:MAG TPA: (2Fe-2S)-binding protein [Phycisphaerales bacterium]|nr:(2Fe-2S)-binding protein [Phycisphaerales bacterium]HMP38598.1 (2Fe-2S)-binding protein [Phycisphaerales bacterium]